MRLNGKKIEGLNVEEIFIPRGEEVILFRAQAVVDYTICDALNPRPSPKKGRDRKGDIIEITDKTYNGALDEYATRRVAFMVIKSLEATEGLEWETVDIQDMNTWVNWRTEFESSGFTEPEIARIFSGVLAACGLDESKVEKARSRFLASRQVESDELSFRKAEPSNTQSGVPASDSE